MEPQGTEPAGPIIASGDPRLEPIARVLGETGWACELLDGRGRVAWLSDEMLQLLGEQFQPRLGEHLLGAWGGVKTLDVLEKERQQQAWTQVCPYSMWGWDPDELKAELGDRWPREAEGLEPAEPPPAFTWTIGFRAAGEEDFTDIRCLGIRLDGPDGYLGMVLMYGSGLPASILQMLTRGDGSMFRRLASLHEPTRHDTAILFADLQSSAALARGLSSSRYFSVIREVISAIDSVVIENGGIVGKHAGDGASAFFIADQTGGTSMAARAAVATARAIGPAVSHAVGQIEGVEPEEVLMNVGVHWGGPLVIGQVVTGGRLEVTALGDEVNECARIQQACREGGVLASKALLERLDDPDAAVLGLDTAGVRYTPLAELDGAEGKALRDAGSIPVCRL